MDPGDVVLIAFPFTDVGAVKRRPALVLMLSGTSFDEGLRNTIELYLGTTGTGVKKAH